MANTGLIEFTSASALSDADKLIAKAKEYNKEIEKANRNTIGGSGSNNRQVIAQIEELNRALAEQAAQIQRLTQVRAQSNQRTQEEITNGRLLAQNANRAALANSTFANAYQRLSAQQAIAATRVQDLIARGRTGEQTQRQYNREVRNAQREFDALNSRVLSADRAVGRFNRNVGNYPQRAITGLRDLVGAFGLVGGVTAFAMIAKDVFNTTKELQSLDLALKHVTSSQEEYAATQEFLLRISEAYGIEINGLTKSYTGFLASSQNAIENGDITAKQIQEIFESVAKASGAMGLSVEQQQGAFLALQQMISKGNVQAEEIRGQLAERLPGAFGILAKSMGVTEKELNKLLKDGQVLAAEVLPEFAKQLEKAYGVENLDRVESLAASTTRLGNAWTNLIREFSEGDGVLTNFFVGFIEGLERVIKGYDYLFSSAKKLREEQLGDINKNGYKNQLEFLKEINDQEHKRLGFTKEQNDEYAKYAANTSIEEGEKRLAQLEEERQKIDANVEALKAQSKETYNLITISNNNIKLQLLNVQYNKSLDQTNLILGQIRASREFLSQGAEDATKKAIELSDKEKKALEKLRKERAKAAEEELQNQYKLKKLIIESEKRTFETIMKDEMLYYSQRETAADDITNKEISLAELARKEGLRRAGKNKTLQLIVWEEYYKDYESIVKDGEERIKTLREDSFKEFTDYQEKYQGEGLRVIDTGVLSDEWNERRKENAEKEIQRLKELRDATDEYLRGIREGFLSDAGLGSLNKFFDQTLDPLTGKMQSTFDKLYEGADSTYEKFAVTFTAITEVAQEAFNFLNQNSQAYFDAQYVRLDREKEVALQFAGESQEGRAEIERQYDERRREIRRREAEQQKELAIFNIIIDTAQAVVSALPNYALAAIVGALGAAQLALVASQPIPAYAMGTDNHKGGLAWVGDGGKHEVVHQPSLGWSITPNTDTLVNLEKGSKVFPDLASSGIFNNNIPDMIALNSGGISVNDMDRIMKKHAPKYNMNVEIGKGGLKTFVTTQNTRTNIMNDAVRFRGRNV